MNNDWILTASEIGAYLPEKVAAQSSGVFQRPIYSSLAGSAGADFLFKVFEVMQPKSRISADSIFT